MCALLARGGALFACWFIHGAIAVITSDVDSMAMLHQEGMTSLAPTCSDADTCSQFTEPPATGSIDSSEVQAPSRATGGSMIEMPPKVKNVKSTKLQTPARLLSPFWDEIQEKHKYPWDIPDIICLPEKHLGLKLFADVLYKVLARPVGGILKSITPNDIETILLGNIVFGVGTDRLKLLVDEQFKVARPLKPEGLREKINSEWQRVSQYRKERADLNWVNVLRTTKVVAKLRRKVLRRKERAAQDVLESYESFAQAARRGLSDSIIQAAIDSMDYFTNNGAAIDWKDVLQQFVDDDDDSNLLLQLAIKLRKRGHCRKFQQAQHFYDAVVVLYKLTNNGLLPR